jgi:hypothetical protein
VDLSPGQVRALRRDGPQSWTASSGETATVDASGRCTWDSPPRGDPGRQAAEMAREVLDLDAEEAALKAPG